VPALVMMMLVVVPVLVRLNEPRPARKPEVPMRAGVRMVVDMVSVSVQHAGIRAGHREIR
jgi:hypothetical protein